MDDKTKKFLEKRVRIVLKEIEKIGLLNIDELANSFKFENRKEKFLEECESCYKSGNFCLEGVSEKYCFLCSCNHYNNPKGEGGCNVGNPFATGKFIPSSKNPVGRIWDCGNCFYPHTKVATQRFLRYIKRKSGGKKFLEEVLENLLVK